MNLLDSFVFEHTEREKKELYEAGEQLSDKRTEHLLWHLLPRHRPQLVVFLLRSPGEVKILIKREETNLT